MLLYDWLNAVVYHMSAERLLFSSFDVSLREGGSRQWRGASRSTSNAMRRPWR